MEADIIIEGFKQSLETHGLKYTTLVGDGDSSVYSKLLRTKPYGPQTIIQKVECRNHLLRNFSSNLRDILKRKRSSSTNMEVPVALRKEVEINAKRLRFSVSKALKFRLSEKHDYQTTISKLHQDILNIPSHVFGEHERCLEIQYFGCVKKPHNINFVPAMKECGLYRDVEICMNRLILNLDSLVSNMDNNLAEHYNSIVSKFVEGKRVNFSKRGSYQTRCEAAAISYNAGPNYYSIITETSLSERRNIFTNKHIQKMNCTTNVP
ncbi:uncharacterized protein [Diabrotica undecimpunctata]|uniref:uncharacterized protein n=1 Tax=Diabrotica undecimpunctata TaxID=50387 RepID=UPI003B641771